MKDLNGWSGIKNDLEYLSRVQLLDYRVCGVYRYGCPTLSSVGKNRAIRLGFVGSSDSTGPCNILIGTAETAAK